MGIRPASDRFSAAAQNRRKRPNKIGAGSPPPQAENKAFG
jgi:hypothetical protein